MAQPYRITGKHPKHYPDLPALKGLKIQSEGLRLRGVTLVKVVISSSNSERVEHTYHQKEHLRAISFQEEYLALLNEYGVVDDERYLWG